MLPFPQNPKPKPTTFQPDFVFAGVGGMFPLEAAGASWTPWWERTSCGGAMLYKVKFGMLMLSL